MIRKQNRETQAFSIKMPKETWLFVKHTAAMQGIHMQDLINSCVDRYKKKLENKLLKEDSTV